MASDTSIQQYYANHRWFVIGGLAAAVAAVVGLAQLRKTPAINVNLPASASSTAGFGPGDILGAYGAGSSATLSGAAGALGLGQGGLDLAGNALSSEALVLQALGTTQAGMGGTLGQILQELIDHGYPVPVAPTPPTAPPTQPSGPTGAIHTATVIRPNGGPIYNSGGGSLTASPKAYGTSLAVQQSGNWWVVVQDGPYYGQYIAVGDSAWSVS